MRLRYVVVVLFVVGFSSTAHASFLGSVIRLEVAHPTASSPMSVPTTATVVTPGAEFPDVSDFQLPSSPLVQTAIDISATSITIDFDNVTFTAFAGGTFNGYILTDASDTLPDFTGATIDTSVTTLGLTPARVSVTPNQIFINVSGLSYNTSTFAKIDVAFGSTSTPTPSGLRAAAIVGDLVTLQWMAPLGGLPTTGYVVEGGIAPGAPLATLPTSSAYPVFTFQAPSGSFYVRVRAVAGGQLSAPSNEIRIHVNTPTPPSAPANLLGLVTGSSVALAWRNTFEGGAATAIVLDVSGTLSASLPLGLTDRFAFDGVPNGVYTLRLRAVNGAGSSAPSDPVMLSFPAPCSGPPLSPERFLASVAGSTVSLRWDPAAMGPAPTSYVLNVSGASNLTVPLAERALSAAAGAGSYALSVAAVNGCGVSAPTVPQVVVVGPSLSPSLTFSATPNPVPLTGVFAGCAGSPTAAKTWVYQLQITNQGTAPFILSSFTFTVTSPLLPGPVTGPTMAPDQFALAFGTSTIAPGATVQSPLCVAGNYDNATLTWSFTGGAAVTFTSPIIRFLASGQ